MKDRPKDISKEARYFYKWCRSRPGIFLGSNSIRFLMHFIDGWILGQCKLVDDKMVRSEDAPVIIPDGFYEYIDKYYGKNLSRNAFNTFSYVEYVEDDKENAIFKWFDLLEDYLVSLGYDPIGRIVPRNDTDLKEGL